MSEYAYIWVASVRYSLTFVMWQHEQTGNADALYFNFITWVLTVL